MAATGKHTNTEFELRGFNHLALVCRDMAETVAWYEDKLGMKLVKTLELPGGRGQHFFLDMGNGVDGIAFFWFPDAPEGVRASRSRTVGRDRDRQHEPRRVRRARRALRRVPAEAASTRASRSPRSSTTRTRSTAATSPTTTRTPTTATCSSGRCTSRTRTARPSSSRAGRRCSTRATSATRPRPRARPSTPEAYRSRMTLERIPASAPAQRIVDALEADGAVIVEDLLDADLLARFNAELDPVRRGRAGCKGPDVHQPGRPVVLRRADPRRHRCRGKVARLRDGDPHPPGVPGRVRRDPAAELRVVPAQHRARARPRTGLGAADDPPRRAGVDPSAPPAPGGPAGLGDRARRLHCRQRRDARRPGKPSLAR